MGAVIAGWAAGYFMAIATTLALVVLLVKVDTRQLFSRVFDPEVARPLLAVPAFIGAGLVWTMIGLVIGSAYEVLDFAGSGSGPGTPSMAFSLTMLMLGLLPVPIITIIWFRFWWLWATMGVLFAGSFGWGLPNLAAQW